MNIFEPEPKPLSVIARIHNGFTQKFGIPRQSGLVEKLQSTIVFEPEFRNPDALRGLEDFSHIWLIWGFSANRFPVDNTGWSPTVRPPRLGGNRRVGVFASRSPNRPNPLGLSCVRLLEIRTTPDTGTVLQVGGADLLDGSPIYDIKPYLPYSDSIPSASAGYASTRPQPKLHVEIPEEFLDSLSQERLSLLLEILSLDPRPPYQQSPERLYGMSFSGIAVRFYVVDDTLHVVDLVPP